MVAQASACGLSGGQLEVFSSRLGRNGVTGGYAVFNVEICRLADIPRHFVTGVTLGHTPGQACTVATYPPSAC